MKTTGSSIASAFRVDDSKVGGGGAGAESGGSVVKQKLGSIIPKKVTIEYTNFAFSPDLALNLPEHTGINDRAIELVNAIEFMRPSKPAAGAPILFDRKLNGDLRLCVNYRSFNNFTMAMLVSMARTVTIAMSVLMASTVTIAMTSLTLLNKLGKV